MSFRTVTSSIKYHLNTDDVVVREPCFLDSDVLRSVMLVRTRSRKLLTLVGLSTTWEKEVDRHLV